jgi:hypothetical protein
MLAGQSAADRRRCGTSGGSIILSGWQKTLILGYGEY